MIVLTKSKFCGTIFKKCLKTATGSPRDSISVPNVPSLQSTGGTW